MNHARVLTETPVCREIADKMHHASLHVSESDEEKNQLEVMQKIEERYTVLQQLWVISKYKVVGSS